MGGVNSQNILFLILKQTSRLDADRETERQRDRETERQRKKRERIIQNEQIWIIKVLNVRLCKLPKL